MIHDSKTQDTDLYSPIASGRISQGIVERIESAIRDGTLNPGDGLPSERELTGLLRVSRVTLRDALRILEAKGLVEIRVGSGGGAFVTAPAPKLVSEGITNMLLLSDVSAIEVTEARFVFELGMLPLVCREATEDDIKALEEICDRSDAAIEADAYDVILSSEFHTRMARCCHNPAIDLLTDAFHGSILASLKRARDVDPYMGRQGVAEHRLLVDAIATRDLSKAQAILTEHLARTSQRLASTASDTGATAIKG